jgi:hypothetical protein
VSPATEPEANEVLLAHQQVLASLDAPSPSNALVIARIEALIGRLDARALEEVSVLRKYWPILAGITIALTRFL